MTRGRALRWLLGLAALVVAWGGLQALSDSAALQGLGVHATAEASPQAQPTGAPAPAAAANEHKASKLEKLSCFGCHSLEHYKKGKPKPVPPPEDVTLAAGTTATDAAEPAAAASPTEAADDADEEGEGDQAEAEDGADEEKAEFSHTLHDEEVGGHCHVCHAFTGHFQVTIRKGTCDGCH